MSSAPRRAEFFALEANEYLADLEPLASAHDRPDAERRGTDGGPGHLRPGGGGP